MSPEEAIKYISGLHIIYSYDSGKMEQRAVDMAIEALERQIPKKPQNVKVKQGRCTTYLIGKCPNCNSDIRADRHAYCDSCGQCIDWTEPVKDYPEYLDLPKCENDEHKETDGIDADKFNNWYCPSCKIKVNKYRPRRCPYCGRNTFMMK